MWCPHEHRLVIAWFGILQRTLVHELPNRFVAVLGTPPVGSAFVRIKDSPFKFADTRERLTALLHLSTAHESAATGPAELQREADAIAFALLRSVRYAFREVRNLARLDPSLRAVVRPAADRHAELIEVVLVAGRRRDHSLANEHEGVIIRRVLAALEEGLCFLARLPLNGDWVPRNLLRVRQLHRPSSYGRGRGKT